MINKKSESIKLLESIQQNIKEVEDANDKKYIIWTTGGSIGDNSFEDDIFNSKEEAQEALKKWKNSYGSSRKYYRPNGHIYEYKGETPGQKRKRFNVENESIQTNLKEDERIEEFERSLNNNFHKFFTIKSGAHNSDTRNYALIKYKDDIIGTVFFNPNPRIKIEFVDTDTTIETTDDIQDTADIINNWVDLHVNAPALNIDEFINILSEKARRIYEKNLKTGSGFEYVEGWNGLFLAPSPEYGDRSEFIIVSPTNSGLRMHNSKKSINKVVNSWKEVADEINKIVEESNLNEDISNSTFTEVGNLWNNKAFSIISDGQRFYVLNDNSWNGESYNDCWEVADNQGLEKIGNITYTITPVYKETNDDNFEIIDYIVEAI